MQRAVVNALVINVSEDLLGEAERVQQYENFLRSQGVSSSDRVKHLSLLVPKGPAQVVHPAEMLTQVETSRDEGVDERQQELDSLEEVASDPNPASKETLWAEPKGVQGSF